MDLFDYMRETAKEKESPTGFEDASDDAGRSSGTAAYHWKRETSISGDQGG